MATFAHFTAEFTDILRRRGWSNAEIAVMEDRDVELTSYLNERVGAELPHASTIKYGTPGS